MGLRIRWCVLCRMPWRTATLPGAICGWAVGLGQFLRQRVWMTSWIAAPVPGTAWPALSTLRTSSADLLFQSATSSPTHLPPQPQVPLAPTSFPLSIIISCPQLSTEERRLLLLAGCLFPLRLATIPKAGKGGKGASIPVSAYIIRESLKWRVKEVDGTALLHEVAPELAGLHNRLALGSPAPAAGDSGSNGDGSGGQGPGEGEEDVRVALGHAIRKMKQHWKLGVLLAPLVHHPACAAPLGVEDVGGNGTGSGSSGSGGGGGAARAAELAAAVASGMDGEVEAAAQWAAGQVGVVRELLAAVHGFGLQDCWQWKPLLDGKEVSLGLGGCVCVCGVLGGCTGSNMRRECL